MYEVLHVFRNDFCMIRLKNQRITYADEHKFPYYRPMYLYENGIKLSFKINLYDVGLIIPYLMTLNPYSANSVLSITALYSIFFMIFHLAIFATLFAIIPNIFLHQTFIQLLAVFIYCSKVINRANILSMWRKYYFFYKLGSKIC